MQDFNELLCSWSGGLEDEELQVQDAVANPSKRSNDSAAAAAITTPSSSNGSSLAVVHSDPAILPAPAQQIPPATQDVKALADQHVPAIPEVKQAGILPDSSLLLW
jgi:protein O-mannose beta-1,4-N-acetylglucosaminyltransferase